jgi:hypothetical protein
VRNSYTKSAPNDAHESCGDAGNGSTPRASRAWCFRLRTPGAFSGRFPNGHPHAGAFSVLPPQACECLRPREPGRSETDIAHTAKAFNRAMAVPVPERTLYTGLSVLLPWLGVVGPRICKPAGSMVVAFRPVLRLGDSGASASLVLRVGEAPRSLDPVKAVRD